MYKKIMALLCLTLSIVLFCMAVSATEAETAEINAIYVSENATEGGTGAIDAPVATLAEAYSLLGNNGTIYLMDTVSVSSTSGDCFVAPAHTGKITITSADGYSGALDFTKIGHFHFGGDTELNNIGIVANEVVLSADNHTVTMGEGLEMSSLSADIYRGGHTYCGAKIHLAAYTPCETANITCEAAGGRLNVYSGEYWSVSAWYGETVTMAGGETQILLDTRNDTDSIWLRYLCPGMYSSAIDNNLTSDDSTVTVVVNGGVNTLDAYRFTKNDFSGSMTVNWLLHNSAQGSSYAFIAKDFYPADDAECTLNVYADQSNVTAKDSANLLMRGASVDYLGDNVGDKSLSAYEHTHEMYTEQDGRILCVICEYEQCRHLTTEYEVLVGSTCIVQGVKRLKCTDLCGEYLEDEVPAELDPNIHTSIKTTYDPKKDRMGLRCVDCNGLIKLIDGKPQQNVYVGHNTGTPITGNNIVAHFAEHSEPVGCSEQYPFKNFEDAMRYAAMAAKQHGSATVHILDDAYVPSAYWTPAYTGNITISGGTVHFNGEYRRFYMSGDITFENTAFKSNRTSEEDGVQIVARNHKLVMGEGIVMGNETSIPTEENFPDCNSVKMYIIGGFIGTSEYVMDTDITIRSGDYWYIGGWNHSASTNNGKSKITIGKTNSNDNLQVFYLTPFSHGDGYITEVSEGTIIVDGEVNVKRFTVTTLNNATTDVTYILNVVLKGDIIGYNEDEPSLSYDILGCPKPYPMTLINVFVDSRVSSAIQDAVVFLGSEDETVDRDVALDRLNAIVFDYDYSDYCVSRLGGHFDNDSDGLCDECGGNVCEHTNTEEAVTLPASCSEEGYKNIVCSDCECVLVDTIVYLDPNNHSGSTIDIQYSEDNGCIEYVCSGCNMLLYEDWSIFDDIFVSSTGYTFSIEDVPTQDYGASPYLSFGNLDKALKYAAISAMVNGHATVYIVDTMDVNGSLTIPSYDYGSITIRNGGLRFVGQEPCIYINGEVTFEYISFYSNSSGVKVFAQNNKLVMGENIKMANSNDIYHGEWACNDVKMYVYGGFENCTETVMNTDITIRSGEYWFVGGWNKEQMQEVSGKSAITIGKTDPEDELFITYLVPYSTGECIVSEDVMSTVVIDGDANVKLFFITTQNGASTNKTYCADIILKGNICPDRTYTNNGFDICASSTRPLDTVVNVYVDERNSAALADGAVFTDSLDSTLSGIGAIVNRYTYEDYCTEKLGGHVDRENDLLCDECGYAMS